MEALSLLLFYAGILCTPLSSSKWYLRPRIKIGRCAADKIAECASRDELRETRAERREIFFGLWPVTLPVPSHPIWQ